MNHHSLQFLKCFQLPLFSTLLTRNITPAGISGPINPGARRAPRKLGLWDSGKGRPGAGQHSCPWAPGRVQAQRWARCQPGRGPEPVVPFPSCPVTGNTPPPHPPQLVSAPRASVKPRTVRGGGRGGEGASEGQQASPRKDDSVLQRGELNTTTLHVEGGQEGGLCYFCISNRSSPQ